MKMPPPKAVIRPVASNAYAGPLFRPAVPVLLLALSLCAPCAASDNVLALYKLHGAWVPLICAAFVALSAALLRWICGVKVWIAWLAPLVAIIALPVFIIRPVFSDIGLRDAAFLTAQGTVLLLLTLLADERKPRFRVLRALFVGLLVSAAILAVSATFQEWIAPRGGVMQCTYNLERLATCLTLYTSDYGPSPALHSAADLRGYLAPCADDWASWSCPGDTKGKLFPNWTRPIPYGVADFNTTKAQTAPPYDRAVIWDARPIHSGGRNVAFLDGHVDWYSEDQFRAGAWAH